MKTTSSRLSVSCFFNSCETNGFTVLLRCVQGQRRVPWTLQDLKKTFRLPSSKPTSFKTSVFHSSDLNSQDPRRLLGTSGASSAAAGAGESAAPCAATVLWLGLGEAKQRPPRNAVIDLMTDDQLMPVFSICSSFPPHRMRQTHRFSHQTHHWRNGSSASSVAARRRARP